MKKYFLAAAFIVACCSLKAQNTKNNPMNQIEDKLALRELVDTFSILADQKETQKQTLLFTEDATSDTYINGQVVSSLKGRKQIGDAFAAFLATFKVVYHINGQQTVNISGDKATGITYCAVSLIGKEGDKRMKTSIGVYYNDDFVKVDGHWLIAKRKATFAWQDKQPMAQ